MGNTDSMPIVSQAKSGFQLVTGDWEGALETQNNFLHECPVVAQVTSLGHAITGDEEGFIETNKRSVRALSNLADGIPVVGHVKAGIHAIAGDDEGGLKAFNAANRTSLVIGGGAGGFLVGGPVGAVAGGIGAGALHDTTATIITDKPQGSLQVLVNAIENPSAGAIFDAAFCPVADGLSGYAAGQITSKIQTSVVKSQIKANNAKLNVMGTKLDAMMFEGAEGTSAQAMQMGQEMSGLVKKNALLESKIGLGEPVLNPKTGVVETPKTVNTTLRPAVPQPEEIAQCEKLVYEELCDICDQLIQARKSVVFMTAMKTVLKMKMKGASREEVIKKTKVLIEETEEEEEDEGEEEEEQALRCLLWNINGLKARLFEGVRKTITTVGTLIGVLLTRRPHVLVLNELKVFTAGGGDEKDFILELLLHLMGYTVLYSPSMSPNGRAMRGTAVAFREKEWFTHDQGSSRVIHRLENNGVYDLEIVKGAFCFHGSPLSIIGAYLRNPSAKPKDSYFAATVNAFKELDNNFSSRTGGFSVFAGDLNMHKVHSLSKWNAEGFVDTMDPEWITNVQSSAKEGGTSIDYVMVREGNEEFVTCYEPQVIPGKSVHYPIYFEIQR